VVWTATAGEAMVRTTKASVGENGMVMACLVNGSMSRSAVYTESASAGRAPQPIPLVGRGRPGPATRGRHPAAAAELPACGTWRLQTAIRVGRSARAGMGRGSMRSGPPRGAAPTRTWRHHTFMHERVSD
jgi:hypothetical protein